MIGLGPACYWCTVAGHIRFADGLRGGPPRDGTLFGYEVRDVR